MRAAWVVLSGFLSVGMATAEDLARDVELMARIGSAGSPVFSPDGTRIAFLTSLGGSPQVWTMSVDGGYPQQVTALDDPVTGLSWAPAAQLAISVAPGGGLNSQVYVVDDDGRGLRRITQGGRTNNWLAGWARDGRAVMLSSTVRGPGALDAYLVSPTGEHRLVARNDGIGTLSGTTRDGRLALVHRVASRGRSDLVLVDVGTGNETPLTPAAVLGEVQGSIAPDGSAVYLSTNKTTDRAVLARIRIGKDGPAEPEILLARDDAEVDGVRMDDAGTTLAVDWNVGGRSEPVLYDVATGRQTKVVGLRADIVGGGSFSPDGRWLAVTAGGAAQPFDIWRIDTRTGEARQLTWSPHPGVRLADLVTPELLRFRAHDGLELSGWLYRAKGVAGAGPTVLSFHGGPEGQARPTFNPTFQALLSRGISVFDANVRGSAGFGKRFVNLDNGALRADGVKDIEAVADAVVAAGVADPKRLGIMGGSYGGYMVMAGLADYPETFAAGANLFGVVNFETFFKHTEPWMAAISTVEYGDPATEAEMLRRLSPIHRVDRVVAPLIVLHGANDTNVPVVEAEQVVESLKKRGVPVEYVLFPDEGHGWRKTVNRVRSTVAIVQWFETHLR